MKTFFRQSMAWLHTWTGLLFGWLLFFMFVTGTAGYFDTEIDRWMKPELPVVQPVDATAFIATALERLEKVAPDATRWQINIPLDRNNPYPGISWQGGQDESNQARRREQVDAVSAEPLVSRDTGGGQLLYQMHWRLHYLPTQTAYWLVGVGTFLMLLGLITGTIVHKKIFVDFFTFRPGKGQRSWLDAHNVVSVISLPFQLMITYSGLVLMMFIYMPLVAAAYYGTDAEARQQFLKEAFPSRQVEAAAGIAAPLVPLKGLIEQAEQYWGEGQVRFIDIHHPGDAEARVILGSNIAAGPLRSSAQLIFDGVSGQLISTVPAVGSSAKASRDVMYGLHEGLFSGPVLRWLYFFSGLLGTVMVASGLILWAVKRRQRAEKQGGRAHFGLRLVERLNIGTITGLPIGIAAYFWANRVLPSEFAARAEWEVHVMFLAWAVMLIHAALRPTARAWVEQCAMAALAFALLPLLNALTTERHLGQSLLTGDWVFAGFDLTMLSIGAGFALTGWYLRSRLVGVDIAKGVVRTERSSTQNQSVEVST
ncbi:PepSY-associated TM helix domain-containing protein [Nitrincola sp. MINF-07-Sa-05]|uniref:PepSY-associated TM helix domain-containing protein n=1 Tax=Nitrincola salilacus TaxID=3400273 RepID=UPI0039181065